MKVKLTLLIFLFHGILTACDVPVFRYALERWERDLYKVFELHRGELNASDQALVEELNKNTIGYGGNTNLICYPVDLDDAKKAKDLYDSHEELKDFEVGDKAEMVLLYPGSTRVFKAIWEGPLNKQNVDELLHSKATGELMKGVLQGYSATFLLMESGDKAKDGTLEGSSFKYTKEILEGNQAMLEFETQIDGKYINGVDIITFNESGKISEFKVMIRPLQAVQIIHEQMQKMLTQFKNNEQI